MEFIIYACLVALLLWVFTKWRDLIEGQNITDCFIDEPNESDRSNAGDITDGDGNFTLEVVGEYYNQESSQALSSRKNKINFGIFYLYPELKNPHDINAVSVWLGYEKVGHLSRADALVYRKLYGNKTNKVLGIIQGGRINDSVWLDAEFGSGKQSTDVFNKPSLVQSFPIIAGKVNNYSYNLAKVMDGLPARIIQAQLKWSSEVAGIIGVYVEGLQIAEISTKRVTYDKSHIPAHTTAIVATKSSGWTVRISHNIVPF